MAMDRSSRPMHRGRKKVCSFCVDRIDRIDYKDLPRLLSSVLAIWLLCRTSAIDFNGC